MSLILSIFYIERAFHLAPIDFMNNLCNSASYKIHIINRPIIDEFIKFLGMKADYATRAVVPVVNIFNCLSYDWTVKDE